MTNNNIKNWCLAIALAASAPVAFAANESEAPVAAAQQNADCTGMVFDSEGEPLPGASVKVVGTTNGGSTNIDGEFSLKGVAKGAKITVSYVGCKPVTVTWNGTPLNITLADDDNVLNEVVVMGYGVEQKRANVTNSIAKVSEKTLTVGTNANPAQALAGAVAGVRVNITSGNPSATPSITLRGGSNFDGGSNQPLFVVDGNIRDGLNDINPNDIADMQILKDAGATALYGARAGNGVILITTKSGQGGKGKVTLNMKVGLNYYSNSGYDITDSETFLNYYRKAIHNAEWALPGGGYSNQYAGIGANDNNPGIPKANYQAWQNYNLVQYNEGNAWLQDFGWSKYTDVLSSQEMLYKDTNIQKEVLNGLALTQDYNLSFSGGNDRGKYYASLGYYDAEGAEKGTFYKRYNFSFTGEYKISDWLTANSVFNYIRSNWLNDNPELDSGYLFNRGRFWSNVNFEGLVRQTDDNGNYLVDENGKYIVDRIPMKGNNGPVNINLNRGKFDRDNQSDKFAMTQSLTAKIIDGLTLKGTMSWYYNEQLTSAFNKDYISNNAGSYNYYYGLGTAPSNGVNNTHSTSMSFLRYFDQTYNLVANFTRTFAEKHYVQAMVGTEFYKRQYKYFSAGGSGAPTQYFPNLQLTTNDASSQTRTMSSEVDVRTMISYFGRVAYTYDSKYDVAATFRQDGLSQLKNNRWGFFPGVSAGWTFSNENFWKDNAELSFINFAKVRGSFGYNGVINTNYLGYYTLGGSYGAAQYNGNLGYRLTGLPNPNLKWEKVRTAEVALDFGFLQNRINFSATYYNRLTMDKYASLSLPQTTGFSSITSNNGKYQNQGVELDLSATILRTRDFQWTVSANMSYNQNKVVQLPDNGLKNNRQGGTQVYTGKGNEMHYIGGVQEGQNPYQRVMKQVTGMVRTQADIDALGDYIDISTNQNTGVYANEAGRQRLIAMGYGRNKLIQLQPGSFIFKDINGDNMIDVHDQVVVGQSNVAWSGGLNTTLSWKGLSLYARFDMGFGFKVYESNMSFWLAEGQGAMSFPTQVTNTWSPENPGAKYPRVVWADQYGCDSYVSTNSFFAQNGNYLACKELSLSYQLPESICKKFKSQGLSLSVTGQNLGYIKSCTIPLPDNTTYWTGGTAGNGGTYNIPRTVIFGLNVSF
ncbi:MAG: SusC/RagA family TonB-linked outer membrane protein [Bacteroides sp.]|nr:SusC/RagA family TonB-linked outer membrane protein [Barnesiella sp.]MBD5256765.1 SusC/RagA family TonB-linked outer membrane protein [Bacteroides sp.]